MPRLLTDEEIFRAKGYHPKVKFHADWVHPVDRKIADAEHSKTRLETAREIFREIDGGMMIDVFRAHLYEELKSRYLTEGK